MQDPYFCTDPLPFSPAQLAKMLELSNEAQKASR